MDVLNASNDVRARTDATASSDMINVLEAMQENYPQPGHLKRVYAYVNSDYSDQEDAASGVLSVYDQDAKVHPDSLPLEMFSRIIVCPISAPAGVKLTDEFFTKKPDVLQRSVGQYSKQPPSLTSRGGEKGDSAPWHHELGHDGFAGIYKTMTNHGRDSQYFVVVSAGAPAACSDLKHGVASSPITFKALLTDDRFMHARDLASRNTERIAYAVGHSMGVQINHEPDYSAFTTHPDEDAYYHTALPMRATTKGGGYIQVTSNISPMAWQSQDTIGVYHKVRPVKCTRDACFITGPMHDGIARFNMNGKSRGFALPATTGPNVAAPALRTLTNEEAKKYATGFIWEGKRDNHHPALHPDAVHAIDDEFLLAMQELGWQQAGTHNRSHMVPVLVKIANPDLKRK